VFTASGARIVTLPLARMAKGIPGGRSNMVLLGYLGALLGLPKVSLQHATERLLGKRPAALEASLAALSAGRAAMTAPLLPLDRPPARRGDRWLVTGNEAAGLGALKGGVRFVAAYPITPATELLEWLSPALTRVGGALLQAEDELASINMAIGGSFGGVPALTATSGPGLALMMESLGLAVAAEIPVVVVDVMRVGPSTGIPTKSEQGDLNIALHGLHGDAPHLVLAPNSVGDCLQTASWAVSLAEALQVPAIVLSDQFLGQARATVDKPQDPPWVASRALAPAGAEGFQRYALTESGISPMPVPGTRGMAYTADGLEHGERGTPSSQAADHVAQMAKRRRKLELRDYGTLWADVEGSGELAIVTFGSCTGPVREALASMEDAAATIRLVSLRLLAPLQKEKLSVVLSGVRKPGGQQFNPGEIRDHLAAWSQA